MREFRRGTTSYIQIPDVVTPYWVRQEFKSMGIEWVIKEIDEVWEAETLYVYLDDDWEDVLPQLTEFLDSYFDADEAFIQAR